MECLSTLATEAVSKLGDLVVESIVKQFKYLIHHNKIIDNLKAEHENLKRMNRALQGQVNADRMSGLEIAPNVQNWLSKVEAIDNELQKFYEDEVNKNMKCFGGRCPDLAFNYSLGKRATKRTEDIGKLKEEKFQLISYPKSPPSLGSAFTEDIKGFESRKKIIREVIETLKGDEFKVISICGMGGVGKTTMVKELIKIIETNKLFDKVVMAVVSQNPNNKEIQSQIADSMDFKFQTETVQGRARQLLRRLNELNKVLIVLDDVWNVLDFEGIGLPSREHQKGCKILFTSRDVEVCRKMGSEKNFLVSILSQDEAWDLFRKMAGGVVDKPDIHPIAKQVANECGGLPIAIVTVGRALGNEEKPTWETALEQLRNSQSSSFSDMQAYVYSRIELSYNFLSSEEHKSFLLLCCLFPEDFDIPVESILRHGVGLGLFKASGAVCKARNRVHTVVNNLKRCFLLLDSYAAGCVKMHDVVRDVVISIASREKHWLMVQGNAELEGLKEDKRDHIKAISLILDKAMELENGLQYPMLELLQVRPKNEKVICWPDNFFQGTTKLKVLTTQNLRIPKMPSLFRASVNLRTLQVEDCDDVGDVSVIGKELVKLEILSFAGSKIRELPTEIGQLGSLRLLDLTGCNCLHLISSNVLKRLSRLEELYLRVWSFPWKKNNFVLVELKNISHHLKVVEIRVKKVEVFPKELTFKNVEKFWVHVALPDVDFPRELYLESNVLEVKATDYSSIKYSLMIMQLVKKCEILSLRMVKDLKNIIYELDDSGLPYLKDLNVKSCPNLEYLVDCSTPCCAFPLIQSLYLEDLDNLRAICNASDHREVKDRMIEFSNLVELKLETLPSLIGFSKAIDLNESHRPIHHVHGLSSATQAVELTKVEEGQLLSEAHSKQGGHESLPISSKLFSSNWMQQFPKLEEISLAKCTSLEMVFDLQEYSESYGQPLSMLFPQLKEIEISDLHKLRYVWGNAPHNVQGFQNLTSMIISQCDSLTHVFNPAIVGAITKLEELEIKSCKSMEILVADSRDDKEGDCKDKGKVKTIKFDKLNSLTLSTLPKIVSICGESYELELPSLKKLDIDNCPKLNIPFLLTQKHSEQDNLTVTSSSTIHSTGFSNVKKNCSRSFNWRFGCTALHTKLIRQGGTNKRSQTTSLARDHVPSISEMKTKVEIGRMPILEDLRVRKCDSRGELIVSAEGDQTRIRRDPLVDEYLFPNLTSLIIQDCNKISILFSPSSSTSLEHLQKLSVEDCGNIEEIVSQEEREASVNKIMFFGLQHLLLHGLPNLKAFSRGSYEFDFPSLQNVSIKGCPKIEMFSQGSSHTPKLEDVTVEIGSCSNKHMQTGDLNATLQGFKAFVALQTSEKLKWSQLHIEGILGYFIKKSGMSVTGFNKLSCLVPFNEIHMFQDVKELAIRECDSLVEVFELEGGVDANKGDATMHMTHYKLQRMTLEILPELRHIWKHNITGLVGFKELTSIRIYKCHSLKSLLSHSMAKSLVQLQEINVENCNMMEEIVTKEDGDIKRSKVKILFPKLKVMKLHELPKLDCVCSGDYDYDLSLCDDDITVREDNEINKVEISFPELENLRLKYVPNLKCFCSGVYDYGLIPSPCNKEIIEECPQIATFLHGIVSISTPNLHRVHIRRHHRVQVRRHHPVQVSRLHRVFSEDKWMGQSYRVQLQPGQRMRTLGDVNLTTYYACNSQKYEVELQKLETFRCIEQDQHLLGYITRVNDLVLKSCHKLVNCVPSNMIRIFQYLRKLSVQQCGSLEEIFESEGVMAAEGTNEYEGDSTMQYELYGMHLHSLPKLKHIWKNHGQVLGFQNLKYLWINGCGDLKFVFPLSIMRSLLQLWSLTVIDCEKMEVIVETREEQTHSRCEEQQSEEAKIIFPKLFRVELEKLPSLSCFCPSSCYFELPSCYRIEVTECPEIETFCHGTIYTPELEHFSVENENFDIDEDLNEVIKTRPNKF